MSILEIKIYEDECHREDGVYKFLRAKIIINDLHFYMDIKNDRDEFLLKSIQEEYGCPIFDIRKDGFLDEMVEISQKTGQY